MIKIKDYIFNENEILQIDKGMNNTLFLTLKYSNKLQQIDNANFSDIEWNYDKEVVRKALDKDIDLRTKIQELEKENEKLREENKHIFANVNDDELLRSNAMNFAEANELRQRIDKAIEYIEKDMDGVWDDADYSPDDLLNILKGEVNE